jgi:hypothetical protein
VAITNRLVRKVTDDAHILLEVDDAALKGGGDAVADLQGGKSNTSW